MRCIAISIFSLITLSFSWPVLAYEESNTCSPDIVSALKNSGRKVNEKPSCSTPHLVKYGNTTVEVYLADYGMRSHGDYFTDAIAPIIHFPDNSFYVPANDKFFSSRSLNSYLEDKLLAPFNFFENWSNFSAVNFTDLEIQKGNFKPGHCLIYRLKYPFDGYAKRCEADFKEAVSGKVGYEDDDGKIYTGNAHYVDNAMTWADALIIAYPKYKERDFRYKEKIHTPNVVEEWMFANSNSLLVINDPSTPEKNYYMFVKSTDQSNSGGRGWATNVTKVFMDGRKTSYILPNANYFFEQLLKTDTDLRRDLPNATGNRVPWH